MQDRNAEERFLGKTSGLPITKNPLIHRAIAMGLSIQNKTVAKLRSSINIALGRSTEQRESQNAQQKKDSAKRRREEKKKEKKEGKGQERN